MSASLCALLAVFFLAASANAQPYNLGIYADKNSRIESVSARVIQDELQRVMTPAGIQVSLQSSGRPERGAMFEKLAVVSFDGNCSVDELPPLSSARLETNRLADAVVTGNGHVQPFFHLDCTRLMWTLRPLLDRVSVPLRNIVFGRAIARVMAHELYHILAESREHAESGIAQPSLSLQDLAAERFEFSSSSLNRIRQNLPSPAHSLGDLAN